MVSKTLTKYYTACSALVEEFCEKQDTYLEFWVGDEIGGIACIGDCFLNMHDIVTDMAQDVPAGVIFDWYSDNLMEPKKWINYQSYLMGLRVGQ